MGSLKNWPEKVKLMQKNWIGKSFGASFIALSPEHKLVDKLKKDYPEIKKELNKLNLKNNNEQNIDKIEKIGVKVPLKASHPFLRNKLIPIFIANFVLIDY